MLVRDEADALERTLVPLLELNLIDTYTIVDTGSTDNTIERALELLAGIPGQIHERPWHGFAHNRTELLELAAGTCDYHLCLDADLIVEQHAPLPELTADAYMLTFAGDFRMALPLLLKDGPTWEWKGAAHSYLDAPAGTVYADLPELTLHETRGSSPRTDKIQRDAELLEAELSPRTIFYLAQTYRDLGYTTEAADLYRLRIRLSAESPEDVFWACYQEGLLRLEADGLERATGVLLEAHQRRPSRAEPVWKLAREYRLKGQPHAALLFAQAAAALPAPADRGFVLAWIYEWGAKMELALTLRALGRHLEALDVFHELAELDLDDEPALFIRDQILDLTASEVVTA